MARIKIDEDGLNSASRTFAEGSLALCSMACFIVHSGSLETCGGRIHKGGTKSSFGDLRRHIGGEMPLFVAKPLQVSLQMPKRVSKETLAFLPRA